MKGSECKFVKYMEGSDKRFVIPVYQRNYDWKTENCKQLYDDLVKIITGGRRSHFFGSFVSVYNPDGHNEEFLVIDGTTVSLFFLAMYRLMDKGILTPKTSNLKQRIYVSVKSRALDAVLIFCVVRLMYLQWFVDSKQRSIL